MSSASPKISIYQRLPFFYGWVVVMVAFVTMGVGVNARNSFSLLFPPILEEFQWSRSETAGSFAIGFVASAFMSPLIGMGIDRFGPRLIFPFGGLIVALGFALSTYSDSPLMMFFTMGILVVGGSVIIAYVGHSAFLPNWFIRRRGLAIGIAFSGVGLFAIFLMPLLQSIISTDGWRAACWTLALMILVIVVPLNLLLQRKKPQDIALQPDGDSGNSELATMETPDNVVDKDWAETDWTLLRALATTRFWWLAGAFFSALYAFYAIQIHQTKYLIEIGFSAETAALALGFVGLTGVAGLLVLGYLSDIIGREWTWSIASFGFVTCYVLLIILKYHPSPWLMYLMVASQGLLGAGMSPSYAAMPAELFQGKHYGAVFGALSIFATMGGATGPWFTGLLYDYFLSYDQAFVVALGFSALSILCVWFAAPRKVRTVSGQTKKRT
jgi:MFS family permease